MVLYFCSGELSLRLLFGVMVRDDGAVAPTGALLAGEKVKALEAMLGVVGCDAEPKCMGHLLGRGEGGDSSSDSDIACSVSESSLSNPGVSEPVREAPSDASSPSVEVEVAPAIFRAGTRNRGEGGSYKDLTER